MRYKDMTIMILIILILAAGYFFFNDIQLDPENAIISRLEEETGFVIEYSSAKLWPLNEITVEELNLVGDNFILRVPKLSLGYSIFDYFNNTENIGRIIKYINLENPELVLNSIDSDGERQSPEQVFSETKEAVFNEIKELYVNIDNGNIYINQPEQDYSFENLSTELKINSNQKEVLFDLKKGLKVKGPSYNNITIDSISTENFRLSAQLKDNNWELNIKNDSLDLNQFESIIKDNINNEELPYTIEGINGKASAILNIQGDKTNFEDYESELKISNSNVNIKSSNNDFTENINISSVNLYFNSNDNTIYADKFDFSIANNDFNVKGYYNINNNNYSGELISNNFKVDQSYVDNFLENDLPVEFETEGVIEFNVDGNLENFYLISDINLDSVLIDGNEFNNINSSIRFLNNHIYVDSLNLETINDGEVDLSGIYDLTSDSYQLGINGQNIRPTTYTAYLDNINSDELLSKNNLNQYLDGTLDFSLNTTGNNNIIENILKTDIVFTPSRDNKARQRGIKEVSANLVYEKQKLFIETAQMNLDDDMIDLSGELNLKDESIYVKLRGEDVGLSFLNYYTDLNIDENNKMDLDLLVKGSFYDPSVEGNLTSKKLYYQDYTVNNLLVDFTYSEYNLNLERINGEFEEEIIDGKGNINLDNNFDLTESIIDITLNSDQVDYNKLDKYLGYDLPVKGSVQPSIRFYGSLENLKAEGFFVFSDTTVEIMDKEYIFDKIETTLNWSLDDNSVQLSDTVISKDDFYIIVDGSYQNNSLDFNFNANNFDIAELGLIDDVRGLFDFKGELSGNINNPEISLEFNSSNFMYNRFLSNEFTGQITYKDDTIEFKDLILKRNSSIYNLSGLVSDVSTNQNLDLEVKTVRGNLNEIVYLFDYRTSYSFDFPFEGKINLNGSIENPEINLDLSLIDNFVDIVELKGNINREDINIDFEGNNIPLKLIEKPGFFSTDLEYGGKVNFTGSMEGSLNDYTINMKTDLNELSILNMQFSHITGELNYRSNENSLRLTQLLDQANDQYVRLFGRINVGDLSISELVLNVNDYNLNHMALINEGITKLQGSLDGNITFGGDLLQPNLTGNMKINLPEVKVDGLSQLSEIDGDLTFNEEKIVVKNIEGNYGEGNFNVTGNINYMNPDNFWELRLKGNNLSFNQGSFNGKFNPDLRFLNEFRTPLIFGDINLYDFIVHTDLNWSESSGESTESFFKPELKLNLIPKENVYFRNENIDILVEGGSLELNYIEDELTLLGRITSKQGTLDYYNNKFLISNVNATFDRFSENMPDIHLVGSTMTSGTRIFIYVDGPADNLNISFGSQPELPEDRIIALLTSRGGLSDFTSEDGNLGPTSFVESEIFRYVGEQVQLNFIQQIERSFANILELDRFELDTYSLAGDREITVYLGKNLSDQIYLQYMGTFSPEITDSEITLEYDINKYLNFEGGWYGEGDYRFLLEANIEF
ncbi:MAG: translocation/assembly module TamB domain-containing protein [Bacillota bacterium]